MARHRLALGAGGPLRSLSHNGTLLCRASCRLGRQHAYLLGIDALRASEAASVRIEDCAKTLRATASCT